MPVYIFLILALTVSQATADCASDIQVNAFVEDYLNNSATAALTPDGTMADALCTQAKLIVALEPHLGPVIGYKAGLTNTPAQKRFGASEPVQGVLYRDMILENGASVPIKWGARPVFEADLILVVGNKKINESRSAEEVLRHISTIHPFIELADLTLAKDQPITPITLTAMGVGPKLGVLGPKIPVKNPAEMSHMLKNMVITLNTANGKVLAQSLGVAVLGHPTNAILWLLSKGIKFKTGDLISVGSFGPLFPPNKDMGGAVATYDGLPGNPKVKVVFE